MWLGSAWRGRPRSLGAPPYAVFVGWGISLSSRALILRLTGARGRAPHTANFLDQFRRDFFQESGRHTRFRHISSIPAAIDRAREHKLVHGARHADVAEPALLLDVIRIQECSRVREQAFFESAE